MASCIRIPLVAIGTLISVAGCTSDGGAPAELRSADATSPLQRAWDTNLARRNSDPQGVFARPKRAPGATPRPAASAALRHSKPPACGPQRGDSRTALLAPDRITQFASSVEKLREIFRVPGAAVALVECDRIVYQAAFGVRELETKRPVTTNTVFRVGSTTKAMTSTLIATLVDEGRLDFTTRVVDIDPTFTLPSEELTNSVTVGQLMGMGTGLGEPDPYWWEIRTASDLMQLLPSMPIASSPGIYLYNNHLYASAAYVGLTAAGVHFPTVSAYAHALEQRVFRPIGMYPAAISDDPASVSPDHAHSYGISLAKGLNYAEPLPLFRIGGMGPAGSVVTNVTSMARFVIAQLNRGIAPNGTRFVSEKNLLRTHTPQTPMPDATSTNEAYAMGWVVEDNAGVQTVWHNGGIDAFGTLMWTVPEDDLGLVVLANGFFSDDFYVTIQESLMRLVYGNSNVDPSAIISAHQSAITTLEGLASTLAQQPLIDSNAIQPYLGRYEHELQLHFAARQQQLVLTAPGLRTVLSSVEGLVGVPLTFVFADGGSSFLQPIRLVQSETGPALQLLDTNTLEPFGVVKKLP